MSNHTKGPWTRRLIAAAPELYDAYSLLVGLWEDVLIDRGIDPSDDADVQKFRELVKRIENFSDDDE